MEETPEIRNICQRIADLYKQQLTNDGAVASHNLVNSVNNWTTYMGDDYFELVFNLPFYYKLAPETEYPNKVSKEDAHPSTAFVESIEKWISDKNLSLDAYAVAKKIMVKGWRNEPRKNLEQTFSSAAMENLEEELMEQLADQQFDIIDKMLDSI